MIIQFHGSPPTPDLSELPGSARRRLEQLEDLARWAVSDPSRKESFYRISAMHLFARSNQPVPSGQHAPLVGDEAIRYWGDYIFSQLEVTK